MPPSAVLDSVVNHLYKVSGVVGATVQIALLGSATDRFAARCSRRARKAWGEYHKNRIEILHHIFFSPDHHAVAAETVTVEAAGDLGPHPRMARRTIVYSGTFVFSSQPAEWLRPSGWLAAR